LDEVIYVGDSLTDVDAFKAVGLSIAFNTECAELKDVATHVVESNVVSDVIKHLS